jgi:3D (Asp-Asp-Asp) domain-containing protein
MSLSRSLALPLLALTLAACAGLRAPEPAPPPPAPAKRAPAPEERSVEVTASAYNTTGGQTDSNPTLTAFGLQLRPGMKIVAVSRDLEALGLREGVSIRIEGLDGEWKVGDRMAARWTRKIDIYMGDDVERAKQWGVRKVNISW